jgi:hypothetical protein
MDAGGGFLAVRGLLPVQFVHGGSFRGPGRAGR